MKTFICFAIFAVATAIPLKEPEAIEVPEGPISFEMLRHSLPFEMPVWRDLPLKNLPEGDAHVAFVAIPDAIMRNNFNFDNLDVSGSKVKVADRFDIDILRNEGLETFPIDHADDEVKVVYSSDASDDIAADRLMYILPNEAVETIPVNYAGDEVKVAYGSDASDGEEPATFDLKNINNPVDI